MPCRVVCGERRKDYGFAVKCGQCSRRALFTTQCCRDCRRQINAGQVHMLTIMPTPKHHTTAFRWRRLTDYLFEQRRALSDAVVAFLRFWRPLQMSRLTYLLTRRATVLYSTRQLCKALRYSALSYAGFWRFIRDAPGGYCMKVCRKDEVSNAIVRAKFRKTV